MIENDEQLDQSRFALKTFENALLGLRRRVAAKNPALFDAMSEDYVSAIERTRLEIDTYLGVAGLVSVARVETAKAMTLPTDLPAERRDASHISANEARKNDLLQKLSFRRANAIRTPFSMSLIRRLVSCWERLYSEALAAAGAGRVELYPMEAAPGSFKLTLIVRTTPKNRAQAIDCFANLSALRTNGIRDQSGLTLTSAFRDLVTALAENDTVIEAEIVERSTGSTKSHLSFAPPTPTTIQRITKAVASHVSSEDVPQADRLEKVFLLLKIVGSGRELTANSLGVVHRQVNYYSQASRILGFLSNGELTVAGRRMNELESDGDRLSCCVVYFEASRVGSAWIRWSKGHTLRDIVSGSAERFLDDASVALSGTTIPRRAKTLESWLSDLLPSHYARLR